MEAADSKGMRDPEGFRKKVERREQIEREAEARARTSGGRDDDGLRVIKILKRFHFLEFML